MTSVAGRVVPALSIGVLALSSGAKSSMAQSMASLGGNLLSVSPNWWQPRTGRGGDSSITRLTTEDAAVLGDAHPDIVRTAPTTWGRIAATAGGKDWTTQLVGSTPEYADLRSYRPDVGRFFTTRENQDRTRVCVIGRTVARELYGEGVKITPEMIPAVSRQPAVMQAAADAGQLLGQRLRQGHDRARVTEKMKQTMMAKLKESA